MQKRISTKCESFVTTDTRIIRNNADIPIFLTPRLCVVVMSVDTLMVRRAVEAEAVTVTVDVGIG